MPRIVKLPSGEVKEDERKNGYVSWTVFTWAIGIILIVFGWFITSLGATNTQVKETKEVISTVKEDVREVKTNISWIVDIMKQERRRK